MLVFNKKMNKILKELNDAHYIKYTDLSQLVSLTKPDFVEIKGCILKQKEERLDSLNMDNILRVYFDRTSYEASYNEVRINDYIEHKSNMAFEGISIALELIEIWGKQLKTNFPNYKFHIIISNDDVYTTIRFYKLRESEVSWIILDNLEVYKEEAILVNIVQ